MIYKQGALWFGPTIKVNGIPVLMGTVLTPGVKNVTVAIIYNSGRLGPYVLSGGLTLSTGVIIAAGIAIAEGITLSEGIAIARRHNAWRRHSDCRRYNDWRRHCRLRRLDDCVEQHLGNTRRVVESKAL